MPRRAIQLSSRSRTEAAWAAGFYDGEGSCSYVEGGSAQLQISLKQNERAPLDRFRAAAGIGKVYGPYNRIDQPKNGNSPNPYFVWRVTGEIPVSHVLFVLGPYLGVSKFRAIMDRLCTWVDCPRQRQRRLFMPLGMSYGSGSKGSLSQLTRKTHKGSGSKGSTSSLVAGTRKTGKQPFPSMARGPVRERARRAGVG